MGSMPDWGPVFPLGHFLDPPLNAERQNAQSRARWTRQVTIAMLLFTVQDGKLTSS